MTTTARNRPKFLRTEASDLQRLFDDSLLVRHLSSELAYVDEDKPAEEERAIMEKEHFDVKGLRQKGIVWGYVRQVDLKGGKCGDHVKSFAPYQIVASTTPIIDLLPLMNECEQVFVLERTKVNGIVTRADLQKWPVRLLLFGLVSLLEAYMLHSVRKCYPGESFKDALKSKRVTYAENMLAERRKGNVDIDLADCLQMCDKRDLLLKTKVFSDAPCSDNAKNCYDCLKKIEKLRDHLAHAQDLTSAHSWQDIIKLAGNLETCLDHFEEADTESGAFAHRRR
jgi:hypothetical protein